ncbi:MAG: adenylate cyclase [Blastocatellia bacterium]|nr:adenylate cyclase [Blastocatellia bacterium]
MSERNVSDLMGWSPAGRKLIAVVYADMVGYSRLIGLDDVGTLQRLKALRAKLIDRAIEDHGGRIVQTGGDSLLIVFDSIEGAVRCAMKVQQQVPIQDQNQPHDRAIRFRIGINIGDAIADGTDLHGEAVNIAARLQAECPPGGICVTRPVRDHLRGQIDVVFDELGSLNLKNISHPVEAFLINPRSTAPTPATVGHEVPGIPDAPPLPDRPSIAVLPFTNLSGDAEQEYFADGMADDIITELSRARWLFVIARNSSFTYKNRSVDVKQVARELGVRYVLEGSVRRFKERLRVNAQLIDAETGNHVWAERFDREIMDVFAIQDEITGSVVTAIEPAMAAFERERVARKQPENLDTWELYQRGLWHLYKFGARDNPIAIEFLLKASAGDPSFADPHTALSLAYYFQVWLFAPQDRTWLTQSLEHGRTATGLDPLDGAAHAAYGLSLLASGEHAAAVKETTLAVTLNPNSAMGHGMHITVLAFSGRPREALLHSQQAMRLSPLDPLRWAWNHWSGMAHYFDGNYEACEAAARDVCRMRPDVSNGYRLLVVALAELGRIDEAHHYANILLARFSDTMLSLLSQRWPEFSEAAYAAYVASFVKGGIALRDGTLTRLF